MAAAELDIVVLGATGFSGVFVAKYLTKTAELKWAIAGRSKEKLEKLLDDLKRDGADVTKIPIFIVDVNDIEALKKTTSQAKIVLNCVGPNTIYSEKIVEACIQTRTHYIDISAEINHILQLSLKYDKAAEDAKVLIIPSCGFASMPAASGLLYLNEQFEGTLNGVECYVELNVPKRAYFPWPGNCLVHYGTWESLVHVLRNMKEFVRMKQETFPKPIGDLPQNMNRGFFHMKRGKIWFPYPGPEDNVIEFSERYLQQKQKKRPIHFKAYTTMPLLIHFIILPVMFLYYYLCYFKCFSRLLSTYPRVFTLGYLSHKGPSEKMMKDLKYSFTLVGKGWDKSVDDLSQAPNKTMKCKVSSNDVYKTTAVGMICAALTILMDQSEMPKGGVVNIPAAYRGTKLVDRLVSYDIAHDIVP